MTTGVAEGTNNDPVIQLVTFRLKDESYGINVMQVQEVLRVTEIAPVPGSPDYVLGIINLRGNVVTVIDTRKRFGLAPKEVDDSTRIVIIEADKQVVGILVDSVAEVVYLRASEIETAPNVGNDESSKYIQGVASRDDELLILVDLNKFLTDEEWVEVLEGLKKGDHIVVGDDIYGGTYRLLEKVFKKWGLQVSYADVDNISSFRRAARKNTRLIWVETPTNPLLKIIDIERLSGIAHEKGVLLAVDNTFASPYFQKPLLLGADIVVHSTTKYIGGHSDIIGGAVVVNDGKLYNELKFYQNAAPNLVRRRVAEMGAALAWGFQS